MKPMSRLRFVSAGYSSPGAKSSACAASPMFDAPPERPPRPRRGAKPCRRSRGGEALPMRAAADDARCVRAVPRAGRAASARDSCARSLLGPQVRADLVARATLGSRRAADLVAGVSSGLKTRRDLPAPRWRFGRWLASIWSHDRSHLVAGAPRCGRALPAFGRTGAAPLGRRPSIRSRRAAISPRRAAISPRRAAISPRRATISPRRARVPSRCRSRRRHGARRLGRNRRLHRVELWMPSRPRRHLRR